MCMSCYFNSSELAYLLHWCMIILHVSPLLRCDTNLWRLKLLCGKHCLCQVAFGFVFRHHCSQLSSHSSQQLVQVYVYIRDERNKVFSPVSRLRPTRFTYRSLQTKCKWKKYEIYKVAVLVLCHTFSYHLMSFIILEFCSWAAVLQLAAYFFVRSWFHIMISGFLISVC
jgi:hypothetical protein